jgi:hypothetical protein
MGRGAEGEAPKVLDSEPSEKKNHGHNSWHSKRRLDMLKKHPELRPLMEPSLLPLFYGVVCSWSLIFTSYWISDFSWPVVFFWTWSVGAWLMQGVSQANHEITHENTGLSGPWQKFAAHSFVSIPCVGQFLSGYYHIGECC